MSLYIGIDPGASGGLALIDDHSLVIEAVKMPASERDILDTLARFWSPCYAQPVRAVIEHVWSVPGQGGGFQFGQSVGTLRMALTASMIPFDPVLPRTWQKALGVVYPKGATDTEKKNITKRRAQQLFPNHQTITHAIADALLMAEYCRRVYRGRHVEKVSEVEESQRGEDARREVHEEAEPPAGRARAAHRRHPQAAEGSGAPRHGGHEGSHPQPRGRVDQRHSRAAGGFVR